MIQVRVTAGEHADSVFLSEKQTTFDTAVSGIISEIMNDYLVA